MRKTVDRLMNVPAPSASRRRAIFSATPSGAAGKSGKLTERSGRWSVAVSHRWHALAEAEETWYRAAGSRHLHLS